MNLRVERRVLKEADYLLETGKTIREVAKDFHISKSTIHKDLHERLISVNIKKYEEIQKIMNEHIKIRHIKGGEATRKKYLKLKKSL